ncbi:MAG: AMP-dependent synthetase [Spirochaetae bacterium HGW-Spirochaetae-7]|nr:MAG: AMP-dependent synthetase [Spirochaetae bacterium HGW-Spirochaetae-7]
MGNTVLAMLDKAAVTYANEPYSLRKTDSGWEAVTYSQTRSRARAFGAWLLGRGFKKGDTAAILAEGSPEWIIGELGLLSAGMISVPLSIKLLADEIPFRVKHSGAVVFLTTRNQLDKVFSALKAASLEPLVVLLDDDESGLVAACSAAGYPRGKAVLLRDALSEGAAEIAAPGSSRESELDAMAASIGDGDVVTISYTSGTTGDPKGIMLTHRNYFVNCQDGVELFGDIYHYSTLIILPLDHSFAHTVGIYAGLVCGLALYFVDARGGGMGILRNIPINLREVEPKFLLTVPALSGNFMKKIIAGIEEKGGFIERLFKAGIKAGVELNGDGFHKPGLGRIIRYGLVHALAKALIFNKVKTMVFGRNIEFCVGGGALLDVKQQEFFASFGVPIFQGYGLTEAAPIISSNSPLSYKFGTSGRIAASIECTIRKQDGSICPTGVTGEIVIRGGNVMKGYYRNPEASAKALRDGWLWTGDLAYMDGDGFLVVVGREKALLIAEDGEKYSPEEIEEAVGCSTDAFSAIMAWNEQRKYTVALVTLDEDKVKRLASARGAATAEEVLALLREEFFRFRTDHKAKKVQPAWIPASFMIVPGQFSEKDGTINSTMKLVRHRVTTVYRDLIDYAYTHDGGKPENDRNLEAVVAMLAK